MRKRDEESLLTYTKQSQKTDGQGKSTRSISDKEKAEVLSDTFSGVFTKEDSGDIHTLPK